MEELIEKMIECLLCFGFCFVLFFGASEPADGLDGSVGQHEHGRHEHERHEHEPDDQRHVGHGDVGHRRRLRHVGRRQQELQRPVPAARPATQAARPLHPGPGAFQNKTKQKNKQTNKRTSHVCSVYMTGVYADSQLRQWPV